MGWHVQWSQWRALANRASCEAHPVVARSLMRRDYGCCGTEKPAERGEVESALRLAQRPNECDALANRASAMRMYRRVVWRCYVLFAARAMRQCYMQQCDDAMQQCYMWQCSGAPL